MTEYIFRHTPTSKDLLCKIRNDLPQYLSGDRLLHTYSVEKEAITIAKLIFPCVDIDEKYLYDISASALLHDITKQFTSSMQMELCKKYNISNNGNTINPAIIHSKTGAYFAKELYNINDIVFGCICKHTTGGETMNIFEKIIFIADFIEERRKQDVCIKTRKFFYDNIQNADDRIYILNRTILKSIDSTIEYLTQSNKSIDNMTLTTRNSLLAECALHNSTQEVE